jgi:hypothetical protein
MSPEEFDIEQYLERVKRRWQSAMLSEEQNEKIRQTWDDTWRIDEKPPREELPSDKD